VGFERAQAQSLLDQARGRLAEIDDALARAASGGYGLCADCGEPIGAERLAARPSANRCVHCAARAH
jgi:DnaK suppressor protein